MEVVRRVMAWMFGTEPIGNLPGPQLISRLVEAAAAAALADGERTMEEEGAAKSVLRRLPAFEALDDVTISMLLAGAFLKAQTTPQSELISRLAKELTSDDERLMIYAVALRVILADRDAAAAEKSFLEKLRGEAGLSPEDAQVLWKEMAEVVGASASTPDSAEEMSRSPSEAFEAHFKAGEAALAQKETLIAEKDFSRAFEEACRLGSGDPSWKKSLIKLVEVRTTLQRYAEAEDLLRKGAALQERELGENDARLADTLNRLGVYLHYPKRKEDAQAAYERSLAILGRAQGEHRKTTALVEWNIGRLFKLIDQKPDAEKHLRRSASIYEQLEGEGRSLVSVTNDLIEMYRWTNDKLMDVKALFTRKLSLLEGLDGRSSKNHLDTLSSFAEFLYYKNQYQESLARYQEWLSLKEAQGPDQADMLPSLRSLSSVLISLQNYEGRIKMQERILALTEKTNGPESKETADALNELGSAFLLRSNYIGAIPFLERTLRIREKLFKPGDNELKWVTMSLTSCYQSAGRKEDAIALTQRSVESLSGEENAKLVEAITSLANSLYSAGKKDEARKELQRAIEIAERVHGKDSIETTRLCDQLGSKFWYDSKHSEAEPWMLRALRSYEALNDTSATYVRSSLATLYSAMNRFTNALPLYEKLVPHYERTYGETSMSLLSCLPPLAVCYDKTGNLEKAEEARQRVVVLYEKNKTPKSPELVYPLNELIEVQKRRSRWLEAENNINRIVEIKKAEHGVEHAEVANAINNAGLVFLSANHTEIALEHFKNARELWRKTLGPGHGNTALAVHNCGICLKSLNRNDEAIETLKEAVTLREKALGESHARTAATQHYLGELFVSLGRDSEAEAVLRKSVSSEEQAFGAYAPVTKGTRALLILALRAQGKNEEATTLEAVQSSTPKT